MADDSTRQTRMTLDLGGEQLLLEHVRCSEALGQAFTLTVDVISSLGELDLLPHLGKPVAVHLYRDDELQRHFHGLIAEGELLRESPAGFHYRLVAHPFTYLLSQNRDMAIFKDLSVPEIIQKVFAAAGQTNYELKLTKNHTPRVYCVQYRESDFHFLTRLMEEEGIYYFYEHSADKHQMILCDTPTAHETGKPATLRFNPYALDIFRAASDERGGQMDYVSSWWERVASGAEATVTLRSFDFKKPERPLQAQSTEPDKHAHDAREIYEYPAPYIEESRGQQLAGVRIASLRRERQAYSGQSQATSLACGYKMSVNDHPTDRLNQEYLITRADHSVEVEVYTSGGDNESDSQGMKVSFDAIPADITFHSPQVTAKPIVQGLETAIVSGPAGEEIYTDEYGRVKVRFHWDRGPTPGEKSSCWMRVAQFGNLGSLILPRVGQEVMVDFLHGDPDHPIVMGWVFNQSLMPIYDLPANKTRATWRTKRYGETGQYPNAKALDTGAPGANELRFEDKGGHEEVFLHAERDMNTRIRFQQTHHVGQNQSVMVGYDRTDDVGNNETTTIGKDQTLMVTGNQKETLKAKRTIDITGEDKLTVQASQTIDVTHAITITAGTSITIQCGASSIKLDGAGITIQATNVTVQGDAMAKLTSAMTTMESEGVTTVKGATVMIN